MNPSHDVLVIGAGAGGLSAALVLGRARRDVLVVDGGHPRNQPAAHLHAFLTRDGTPPLELLEIGRQEVAGYGVEVVTDRVARLERTDDGFSAELASGRLVSARRVIVATGLTDTLPEIPGLREGWGVDVLHCPYCHGHEVAGRRLGVLGTSPMSGHQARMVRQWSADLTFFTNDVVELDDVARGQLEARGVRIVDGPVVEVAREGGALVGVTTAGGTVELDAVFAASTMEPNADVLDALGATRYDTPMGSFVETDAFGATSVPGVWAVGNVTNPGAQVVVAAAEGSVAAAHVNGSLIEEEFARA